jgi:Uncharacterized protein conserved in bacteria
MPSIESFRKQAKLVIRWHRERDYTVGGKVRLLVRFRHLSDAEILAMPLPLAVAQEIVAVEAGYADWQALKDNITTIDIPTVSASAPILQSAIPILFVRDVAASAAFFETMLGFDIDFLHGLPSFYGAVSRNHARLHLRFVERPNFAELAVREMSLILATIEVTNVKALFEEFSARGIDFPQKLTRHPWGGIDFHVRDPDGNIISFVQYLPPATASET